MLLIEMHVGIHYRVIGYCGIPYYRYKSLFGNLSPL